MTQISPLHGGVVAPWCDADAVQADARISSVTLPTGISMADIVQSVSEKLYKLSGTRWAGQRTDTVRPHRLGDDCQCGLTNWLPPAGSWGWDGIGGWWNRVFPEGWGCGCLATNQYRLPGGLVQSVDEIIVDGEELDPETYTVYDNARLVRLADPATSAFLTWPCCQRLEVPITEVGTWQVTYTHGQKPPISGTLAAYTYSLETARRYDTSKQPLPARVQRVSRQDIDINIESDQLLDQGRTGFPEVDEFIEAYNPGRLVRRARVYDPDTISPAIVKSVQ